MAITLVIRIHNIEVIFNYTEYSGGKEEKGWSIPPFSLYQLIILVKIETPFSLKSQGLYNYIVNGITAIVYFLINGVLIYKWRLHLKK